jgi:hypothetical protein
MAHLTETEISAVASITPFLPVGNHSLKYVCGRRNDTSEPDQSVESSRSPSLHIIAQSPINLLSLGSAAFQVNYLQLFLGQYIA